VPTAGGGSAVGRELSPRAEPPADTGTEHGCVFVVQGVLAQCIVARMTRTPDAACMTGILLPRRHKAVHCVAFEVGDRSISTAADFV
jgi:hypothetical protein